MDHKGRGGAGPLPTATVQSAVSSVRSAVVAAVKMAPAGDVTPLSVKRRRLSVLAVAAATSPSCSVRDALYTVIHKNVAVH